MKATRALSDRLSVSAGELGELLGVSRSHVYRLDGEGRLPQAIHLGGRRIWLVEEVRAWLRSGAPRREVWEQIWESKR